MIDLELTSELLTELIQKLSLFQSQLIPLQPLLQKLQGSGQETPIPDDLVQTTKPMRREDQSHSPEATPLTKHPNSPGLTEKQ